ncbi:uncharacterized protein [Littorina saxatilis]|uniref:uncharacterized protein isoform X1 n=1 Tax=Littorina saxatilis TaxID=31220 RepID=UPI0038B5AB81
MKSFRYKLLLLAVCVIPTFGVTVSPCGSDQTAEVIQNKADNTYTCSGVPVDREVTWTLLYQTSDFLAGNCPINEGACTGGELGDDFTTSRVNSTAIRLTVNATGLDNDVVVRSGTLKCSSSNINDNCQTDYVFPAQGTCSTQTGTGSERFTRTGSCSLQDGAMTSRGRYRCEWYQMHQTSSKSLIVNKTPTAANYQTDCVMKTTVPTVTGQYKYTVTLIPGRAMVNAGDINIVPGLGYGKHDTDQDMYKP